MTIEELERFFADAVEVFRSNERDELLRLTVMEIELAGVPQHTQSFMIMLDRFGLDYSRKVQETCTEFVVNLLKSGLCEAEIIDRIDKSAE